MSRAAPPPVPYPQDPRAEQSYRRESHGQKQGRPMMYMLFEQKRPQERIDREGANRKEDNQEDIDWKSPVHRMHHT
jgi:hypothetical protein